MLLSLFVVPDPHLMLITTAQHLAGLVVGAVVYWYLDRRGVSRWLALVATALVVLDGYAIALEQYVMPEPFFATAVLGSLVLLTESRGTAGLVLSGLLLGGAVTIRTAGLFVIPCWILYLLVARRGWRPSAAGIVAAALPLIALGLVNQNSFGSFSMNSSSGWFLYGRIGEIAECGKIDYRPADRGLCSQPAPDEVAAGLGLLPLDDRNRRPGAGLARSGKGTSRNRIGCWGALPGMSSGSGRGLMRRWWLLTSVATSTRAAPHYGAPRLPAEPGNAGRIDERARLRLRSGLSAQAVVPRRRHALVRRQDPYMAPDDGAPRGARTSRRRSDVPPRCAATWTAERNHGLLGKRPGDAAGIGGNQ